MGAGNRQLRTLPDGAVTRTERRMLEAFGICGSSLTMYALIAWQRKGWVTPPVATFSAEPTWGSVPVKSRCTSDPATVRATLRRIGTSDWRSSSM